MATINLLTEPQLLEPINTDLWYRVNSASSSITNFKYVFKPQYRLEPFTGGYTQLSIYRVPPRPITGDGLFSPHRVLKSFIDNQVNPYQTGWISGFVGAQPGIPQSLINYNVKYGFEFSPNLQWYNTSNIGGLVALTFSSTHPFLVGDVLILDKDNKNINPQYDGTCSINTIVNPYQIITDITYGTSSTVGTLEGGYITTLQRLTATSSTFQLTWNGTRQYTEGSYNFTGKFILASASTDFLTNYPYDKRKKVRLDDWETISMINQSGTNSVMFVETYNQNNTLINTYSFTQSTGSYRRVDFGIGPKNLVAGGVSFFNTSYYKFYTKYLGVTSSRVRTFDIDTQCSSYDNVRVCFLNRAGGFDYANFTLDSKKSVSISRTEYEKVLAWDYSLGDRGKTILAQTAEPKMTITSNWLTETESVWLEELLTSPEVWVLGSDAINGNYILPIVITDTNYEVKTYMRNQVFNLQLNFKYAYDLNLQNQ